MPVAAEEHSVSASETAAIRHQLEALLADDLLRTSKRSVAFLRYIVEETLLGHADDLKERTIGVNVFGKALTYDTNLDHVVRTAASELRKRLALYYGKEEHRGELRILLVPGSYVPQFRVGHGAASALAAADPQPLSHEPQVAPESPPAAPEVAPKPWGRMLVWAIPLLLLVSVAVSWRLTHRPLTLQQRFWRPLLETSGPLLVAVGDVPSGPPIPAANDAATPSPARSGPPSVPFADVVTIARVGAILSSFGKDFLVRQENSRSFADLRERPVVLIGAFNNEWSLQLTRNLRFTLALDPNRHLLYIRDRDHPDARLWAWDTGPHPVELQRGGSATLHDYALITRILDSETGHDVIVMGGLYAYGTQAAGEFLSDRDMASLPNSALSDTAHKRLQIVLETTVTDGTPGPPHVVAVNLE
jgi:hypothetical protein